MDSVLSGAELCPVALVAGEWKKVDAKERLAFSALEGVDLSLHRAPRS